MNDAISIHYANATLASACVARWCAGSKVETAGGVFRVRDDEPAPRTAAGLHRTPEGQARHRPFGTRIRRRNLIIAPVLVVATLHREADRVSRIDPAVLTSRGTLAGDLLWLATIAFVFAIITGMLG